jgi:hypothetical protein
VTPFDRRADRIRGTVQHFLWHGRIPVGHITVVAGPPSKGKSRPPPLRRPCLGRGRGEAVGRGPSRHDRIPGAVRLPEDGRSGAAGEETHDRFEGERSER